ncbi:MAG TPA: 3-methyl-2-oxobutanoate hydroxymethyltransferase [Capsulimonadaceae bacterium]|nr:3-methyl-2-oxobutanoate hydroxymethyltransferase [Capsulimonadaceae bacterium]
MAHQEGEPREKPAVKRITIPHLLGKKPRGEKITMLTAYDYPTARLVDEAEVDIILVGDSLGTEELGYKTTLPVTMEEMLHHVKAVRRGAKRALLLADMPFLSYQVNTDEAVRNAGRLLQEGGANAVKLEGGVAMAPTVHRLAEVGIPVMGHIGLTPQYVNAIGLSVQGRSGEEAERLKADAQALQQAGAFAVLMELVPRLLAGEISQSLTIPTVGIGSGPECDGQVLVTSDLIGLRLGGRSHHHAKRYADVAPIIRDALVAFRNEVETAVFPTEEHSF